MLKVKLASVGNVDYEGIDYRGELEISPQWVEVSSLEDASTTCRTFIEEHGLGGGNWDGGVVINEQLEPVGYISYNGRIWTPEQARERGNSLEVTYLEDIQVQADVFDDEVKALWDRVQAKAKELGVAGYSSMTILPGTSKIAVKVKLLEVLTAFDAIQKGI